MDPSGHPSPDLLESAAFGNELSQEVLGHIAGCPACTAAMAEFRENNEFLVDLLVAVAPKRAAVPRPAESVPGYRILKPISAGGQGVVYKAVQERTGRTVALKVLGGGWFATDKQRKRFEREIDIAASLRHPNIATVYDAVELRTGLHAFAMEYIEGVPLDRWEPGRAMVPPRESPPAGGGETAGFLDPLPRPAPRVETPAHVRFSLPTLRAKLAMFAKVCDAVHHAHQHGIIHRDLKPSNVLTDAAGEPHVLDFGIAVFAGESEGARVTQSGEFTGTVEFASPEQAGGEPTGIDFRTDVYSLGVILFAMLTGEMPYAMEGPTIEKLRAIQLAPPRRPGLVHPVLRGDIETMILKALDKDRTRRYQTAAELGADIRHYLAGEAIQARRDSVVYVLGKRAARHRGKLIAAAVILLAGAGALGLYAQERARFREAQSEAKNALLIKDAKSARELAQKERESIARIGSIVAGAFGASGRVLGDSEVQRMKESAARLEHTISDARAELSPTASAELRLVLAGIYRDVGLYPDAAMQLAAVEAIAGVLDEAAATAMRERAAALRARLTTPAPPESEDGAALLIRAGELLARDESEAAMRTAGRAAAALRAAEPPDEIGALLAEDIRARALLRAGKAADAEHAATAVVESLSANRVGNARPLAIAWTTVAEARLARGDESGVWDALARGVGALSDVKGLPTGMIEALGPLAHYPIDDPREEVRAPARQQGGRIAAAAIGLMRAWEQARVLDMAERLFEIAAGIGAAFDTSLAIPFAEAGLAAYEQELASTDPRVIDAMWRIGRVLTEAGDPEDGARIMKAAWDRAPESLSGQFAADHLTRLSVLCGAYAALDRWSEIAGARAAELVQRSARLGEREASVLGAELWLARALTYAGDYAESERRLAGVRATLEARRGGADTECLKQRAAYEWALLRARQGRGAEAVELVEKAGKGCDGVPGAAEALGPGQRVVEGVALAAAAKYDEADVAFRDGLPVVMNSQEPAMCRPLVRDAAAMYERWGKAERAKELRAWLAEGLSP